MYARFFRWASDRLDDDGVLAFITNRSFIDSRTFDGFRKVVAQEFTEIYVVDLGGDVRANPKLSGTKHNVFGIQTGVAISLPGQAAQGRRAARYSTRGGRRSTRRRTSWRFWRARRLSAIALRASRAGQEGELAQSDETTWDELIPLASKEDEGATRPAQEQAIFQAVLSGVSTNRDEWVYDYRS